MCPALYTESLIAVMLFLAAPATAQIALTGRVVDETGAAVSGARVELRARESGATLAATTDEAGSFKLTLPEAGDYTIRAERLGFYRYEGAAQRLDRDAQLTVTLNHQQEFSEKVNVTASSPVIDPQRPAEHKELDNTEVLAIPNPNDQDYRSALPLLDGVVQDNQGGLHFNGGNSNQANYTLDGFNISNPVTGTLDARINVETIQAMNLESSRFSAENSRGSAGVLDLQTKMGDDRWRFGATNFFPGVTSDGGFHVDQWTPRLEFSGPVWKGRAWFHDGFDAYYSDDVVNGLPEGQNRTRGLTTSNLSRFQVDVTPANILTGSFLFNLANRDRVGLSFLNPIETTTNVHQDLFLGNLKDQIYFGAGALLELGIADSRGTVDSSPQGTALYEITPTGDSGNYFTQLDRHYYRKQGIANIYLPTWRLLGSHQLKFGVDLEREGFHQHVTRHPYEVLRDDNSIARYVTFAGNPFQARRNLEAAEYIQDAWTPREGLRLEGGLRAEWNEIVRDFEVAPRFSVAWAPNRLRDTKFSAGWGVYYDAISLETVSRNQDQVSLSTFFPPGAPAGPPVETVFTTNEPALKTPYYRSASFSVERKLPHDFYLKSGYLHRTGNHGFAFVPIGPAAFFVPGVIPAAPAIFQLTNSGRDRYDAVDLSLRHTFAGKYEWFAGYTRSSARTNEAVNYNLENPVFGPQSGGPLPWDSPNRFHMWGWAPLPVLPPKLRFITRNTTAAYLVEYRTGFPFSAVTEDGFLSGPPNSVRMPDYFDINLHFERRFRVMHYLWAWRCGFNNITNNGNPNAVNNVIGTPQFLTYARGQKRAFAVRLRFLGRK